MSHALQRNSERRHWCPSSRLEPSFFQCPRTHRTGALHVMDPTYFLETLLAESTDVQAWLRAKIEAALNEERTRHNEERVQAATAARDRANTVAAAIAERHALVVRHLTNMGSHRQAEAVRSMLALETRSAAQASSTPGALTVRRQADTSLQVPGADKQKSLPVPAEVSRKQRERMVESTEFYFFPPVDQHPDVPTGRGIMKHGRDSNPKGRCPDCTSQRAALSCTYTRCNTCCQAFQKTGPATLPCTWHVSTSDVRAQDLGGGQYRFYSIHFRLAEVGIVARMFKAGMFRTGLSGVGVLPVGKWSDGGDKNTPFTAMSLVITNVSGRADVILTDKTTERELQGLTCEFLQSCTACLLMMHVSSSHTLLMHTSLTQCCMSCHIRVNIHWSPWHSTWIHLLQIWLRADCTLWTCILGSELSLSWSLAHATSRGISMCMQNTSSCVCISEQAT